MYHAQMNWGGMREVKEFYEKKDAMFNAMVFVNRPEVSSILYRVMGGADPEKLMEVRYNSGKRQVRSYSNGVAEEWRDV